MKKHFFVTGYPRSRTCWVANLLSTPQAFCWHDGLVGLERLEEMRERLEQPEVPIVGLSDPALLLFWETFDLWYPEARWVVIERDLESSFDAMAVAAGQSMRHDFFLRLEGVLERLVAQLRPLVIPFDGISPKVARRIGDYVGVDVGPKERVEQLCGTNVQIHNLRGRMARYQPPQFLLNLR